MSNLKCILAVLAFSSALSVGAQANAATVTYSYSDWPHDVKIGGVTEYEFGMINNDFQLALSPVSTSALVGTYSATKPVAATDTFNKGPLLLSKFSFSTDKYNAVISGDSYADLKFAIGATTYTGVASFTSFSSGNGTFVELNSITYAPLGVPEPAAWGLMLLGVGLVGAALRQQGRAAKLAI